jgi:hypothetical protein
MPSSLTFDHFMNGLVGNSLAIVPATNTTKLMLVNGYTPNQASDANRSNVSSETTGTGYTSGGLAATITTSLNTSTHVESMSMSSVEWTGANTFSATGAVLYTSNGGASSGDPIWAYMDFGGTVSCVSGTFTVTETSALTITN